MECKRCKGKTQKAGIKAYVSGKYQMYRCTNCGHHFRGEVVT